MVGREVVLRIDKPDIKPGRKVLELTDVHVVDSSRHERVKGVSFDVYAGEIFGLAGIDGNGQFELVDAIAGLLRTTQGQIRFNTDDATNVSIQRRMFAGIAYVPQDRHLDGLVLDFNLVENTILRDFNRDPFSRAGIINFRAARSYTERLIREFDVRPPQPDRKAADLSGGNQQKVIIAREVSRGPMLLIAAQPTRGLDVGAIEGIHRQLLRLRSEQRAVLLVSLELDEILSLSDRIGVMHDGKLVGIVDGKSATREQIGLMMTGVRPDGQEVRS
jgi:simple sugar transport system ATP-binding protein